MNVKILSLILVIVMLVLSACANSSNTDGKDAAEKDSEGLANSKSAEKEGVQSEETEIQVFIAASLHTVMEELADIYHEKHPEVTITYSADSSGTLMNQIEEGFACDIFFSAAQKQMDQLETDGFLVDGTRANVVNNQVVVLTQKDSETTVTGLEDLGNAESIALAGGSVPVGKYTREALIRLGILEETEAPEEISTTQISEALGGVEISEQPDVSSVLKTVAEGACEVGTTYYSDTYGYEEEVEILQIVSGDLTGDVIYPIAQIVNPEADDAQSHAAAEFLAFLLSDEAKSVFEDYYFDTEVK